MGNILLLYMKCINSTHMVNNYMLLLGNTYPKAVRKGLFIGLFQRVVHNSEKMQTEMSNHKRLFLR
jgi:hypothetical protein